MSAARQLGRMDGYRREAVGLLNGLCHTVDSEYAQSYARDVKRALEGEDKRDSQAGEGHVR